MKKLITLTCFLLLIVSCNAKKETITNDPNAGFDVLKKEAQGGKDKPGHETIRSQEKLAALYKELNVEEVPQIDFASFNVVVLYMGQKNTGGYSIDVANVGISGDTAYIKKIEAAPEDMATMALTYPYVIVKIPKTDKVVVE